jgi:hypothetical protein
MRNWSDTTSWANGWEDRDRKRLHLTGVKLAYDPYPHILLDFLTDQERAGQYMLTKEHYMAIALKMAKYLSNPKSRKLRIFITVVSSTLTDLLVANSLSTDFLGMDLVSGRTGGQNLREKKTKETFQARSTIPFRFICSTRCQTRNSSRIWNKIDLILFVPRNFLD